MIEKQNLRITSLTSLRFFAAFAVFLRHLEFLPTLNILVLKDLFKVFYEGFVGVNFFFVLSGFIISYSYTHAFAQQKISAKDFFVFRIFRLYPLHLLALIASLMVYPWVRSLDWDSIQRLFVTGFLLQSFVPPYTFSFNAVSWSISTEMFFYAMFCVLVPLRSRYLIILFALLLGITIFSISFVKHFSFGNLFWFFYVNPFLRLIDFVTGMLLYRFYVSSSFSPTPKTATYLECLSLCVLGVFLFIALIDKVHFWWRLDIYYLLPIALVVLSFAYNKGRISQWLSHRYWVFLGEASFSFYMIHQMIINIGVIHIQPSMKTIAEAGMVSMVMLFTTIGLSSLIFVGFEKPINTYLRKKWLQLRKQKSAPQAEAGTEIIPATS